MNDEKKKKLNRKISGGLTYGVLLKRCTTGNYYETQKNIIIVKGLIQHTQNSEQKKLLEELIQEITAFDQKKYL